MRLINELINQIENDKAETLEMKAKSEGCIEKYFGVFYNDLDVISSRLVEIKRSFKNGE